MGELRLAWERRKAKEEKKKKEEEKEKKYLPARGGRWRDLTGFKFGWSDIVTFPSCYLSLFRFLVLKIGFEGKWNV